MSDAAALGGANRDVLQIGIGRGQAPGCGYRLLEGRVDTGAIRIQLQRQFVGVGRFEFGQRPLLQNKLRQFVLFRQLRQHGFRGRRLPGLGLLNHRQA